MQNLTLVSEDNRRKLFEFGEGLWKCAKYVEVKEDCIIGNHYHKLKDECFLLTEGEMIVTLGADVNKVSAPCVIDVPRGTYHKFEAKKGCKIVGLCSEGFNKHDDHL